MGNPKGNCIALTDLNWDYKELVGSGQFGDIYRSTWYTHDDDGYSVNYVVAIKDLRQASTDEVFAERNAKSELSHPNVVALIGFVQLSQKPMLVFEYTDDGSVWDFIREARNHGGATADTMMNMALNIAKGMDYLHSNNVIHGDLALRNCIWIESVPVVKVGDLGFYDDDNSDCYYKGSILQGGIPCPIRWMAPENLPFAYQHGCLVRKPHEKSYAGDIWSFGVVLFELWARGRFPFDGVWDEEVCKRVLNGQTALPWNSPLPIRAAVKDLMQACWQTNPNDRPDFSDAIKCLEDELGLSCNDNDDDYYSDSYDYDDNMDTSSEYSDY